MTKPIEKYREEVDDRLFESHNEYRQKRGRVSRYVHLKNRDVSHWIRNKEVKRYKEAALRMEQKVAADIESMLANEPTFQDKQIAYDEARGAYRTRTFLEATLKMKHIEPQETIEGMLEQYEEWKAQFDVTEEE